MAYNPGEYVIDWDDDDPDLAVVVHSPDMTIGECAVTDSDGGQRTVAADNPEYDEDENAVVIAFVESGLAEHWPEWEDANPDVLYTGVQEHNVKQYTFPESRLVQLNDDQATLLQQEDTGVVALKPLQEKLEHADWKTDLDNDMLVVEKSDEQYRIYLAGDVEGDGPARTPLENIVTQYLM
ncbi:hypothetical protein [Natronococcus wangiae]|uniref:hypothetical protein n=1 Tax=Natronococcus wangiae TaxID=3068275 RepID=UPI00273F36A6|nr:hypothetical protein [Natronococcus sp. AD5]